jgi:signal peptidase II
MRNAIMLCVFLVIIDQITKYITVYHFAPIGSKPPITVIPNFFNLVYVLNPGAAWGILAGWSWLLLLISVVAFAVILYFMRSLTEGWPERYISMFMIISGIIGNTIDRLWQKAVVDFLDFYIGKHHWPAFNVADSAITVGVIIFLISSFFRPELKKETSDEKLEKDAEKPAK